MNAIYILGAVVIALLFYYHYKSVRKNKEQIYCKIVNDVKPEMARQIIPDIALEIKPEIVVTRNTFLYPTDEFGKLEKGVVYDSNTYLYELNENNRNDLVILSEKELLRAKWKKRRH